jgi:hypothetical protein
MNKYEKLIEYIINENEQKARELFHEIVVEKSRDIYESLMDEEQMGETFGGDGQQALADEIQADHTGGIAEEEGEEDEFSLDGEDSEDEDELGGDLPPTDMDSDDMGGDEPATKADIDELKDMFAEIQSQLDGGHSEPDADNMDDMDSMDGPTEVGAEEPKFGEGMMEAEESDEDTEDDKDEDKEDKAEVKETKSNGPKSVAQLMREYVDQIGQVYGGEGDNAEGTESGNGKKVPVNTKSITRTNGPDFGGTSKNILNKTGATNDSPDGKQTPKPNNEYSKGEGKFSNEKFQNAPGGSKKTSPVGKNWESANSPEGQTTGGKVPVTDKTVLKQNTGK